MSKHYGNPEAEPPRVVNRRRLLQLALGTTLGLIIWGYLVTAAIHFGGQGRRGDHGAWVLLGLATVGAAACFFVVLILLSKVIATMRGNGPPPRVAGGGKRAAR